MPRVFVLAGLLCLIVSRASAAPVLLGSFSGQFTGGFTSNVQSPTGFRINFSAIECLYPYAACGNPSYPSNDPATALFGNVGLILPSSTTQVFVADVNTPGFALIASILTSPTTASVSQLFYCNEAITITNCVPYASGAQARPPTVFEFPNATITSIEITLSPWSWVQDSNGSWWRRQADGSFATVTVSAHGVPGFGVPPVPPPSAVPESPSALYLSSAIVMMMFWQFLRTRGSLRIDIASYVSRRRAGNVMT